MDFCLNIFKVKFKEYIQKLDLITKLQEGDLAMVEDKKKI